MSDLTGISPDAEALAGRIVPLVTAAIGVRPVLERAAPRDDPRVGEIVAATYGAAPWTFRR